MSSAPFALSLSKGSPTETVDFDLQGCRYQVKGHRPSGKKGSKITHAGKARNYDWDCLVWLRYDEAYALVVRPDDVRRGRRPA